MLKWIKQIFRFDDKLSGAPAPFPLNTEFMAIDENTDPSVEQKNKGDAYLDQSDWINATACYLQAIAINPENAGAHNNLALALCEQKQYELAIVHLKQAVLLNPKSFNSFYMLGNIEYKLDNPDAAREYISKAVAINPDFAEGLDYLGLLFQDRGEMNTAVSHYRHALKLNPTLQATHSNLLFAYNFLTDQAANSMVLEARRFDAMVTHAARPYTDWQNTPNIARRLRVGLVSGDLRNHPVGCFIESVLGALASNSADRLELIAYSNFSAPDEMTERIKLHCDEWHFAMELSDEDLAQQIRNDGIDILIDLSGHTAHNRLPMFAWKPAPVQVTWLGYFATTGVAAIDYLIADPWTLPASEEVNFTETIWRLPETRLCFSPPHWDVKVATLPALANGYITFGCFNNLAKMNDEVVALWARILQATPESRLFLKAKALGTTADARDSTIRRFAAHGVREARLIFEGFSSRESCLASYHKVDIALDPFPYTGGTTTVEALWMGVPVITLAGQRFISRQGVGLLMNAGLADWVATDADDYVERTVRHANDLPRLAMLRGELRHQVLNSPIFDAPRFAHYFESALRDMWIRWCEQQKTQA